MTIIIICVLELRMLIIMIMLMGMTRTLFICVNHDHHKNLRSIIQQLARCGSNAQPAG